MSNSNNINGAVSGAISLVGNLTVSLGVDDTCKKMLEGEDVEVTLDATTLSGTMGGIELSMPKTTGIGDEYFAGYKLKSIDAPKVTTVGEKAFYTANIGDIEEGSFSKVTDIGENAFCACKAETSSVSFDHLTEVDEAQVFYQFKVKDLNLPELVTVTGAQNTLCAYATGDFSVPKLTSLRYKEFANAKAGNLDLHGVTTLAGTTNNCAFYNVNVTGKLDLRNFVGTDNTDAGSASGYTLLHSAKFGEADLSSLKYANYYDFYMTQCDEVHLPALEIAGNSSFNSTKIKKVYLDKVTAIKAYAFAGSSYLTDIYIGSASVPTVASTAFNSALGTLKVHVPSALLASYQADSGWSAFSSRLVGDYDPA